MRRLSVLGVEGVGVVEAVGAGVADLRPGQRVAYAGLPAGSYATARNIRAERLIALPDTVPFEQAAGAMLRSITAHVIGTVGNRAKAELALAHGLDRAVLYRDEDSVAAARDFSDGAGVHYAIDGIGGDPLRRTLDAVRPFGMAATIGQVAGDIDTLDPALLGPFRSIALSRPGVFRFMTDLQHYREGAAATLARMAAGMQVQIGEELPLASAAQAPRLLEAGQTTGSMRLRP
jgi:NADPH:quinone reductase